jgi:hypothetical protein
VWVEAGVLEPAPAGAAVFGKHHPPPPAPGTDAPVKIGGIRLTTQLFAGALVLIGAVLPWSSSFFGSQSAFGVPFKALISPDPAVPTSGFLKLAFLLVPLGVVVLLAGLRILPTEIGRVAGGIAALVAFLFAAQLQRTLGDFLAATVFGVLGVGVYVTLFAGAIAAASKGDRA